MAQQCPCCQREFTRFSDFPLIHVVRFARQDPEIFGAGGGGTVYQWEKSEGCGNSVLPAAVRALFEESGSESVRRGGTVYHRVGTQSENPLIFTERDITDDVKPALHSAPVQAALAAFEKLVGYDAPTKDLLAFQEARSGQFGLSYESQEQVTGNLRTNRVCLRGHVYRYSPLVAVVPIAEFAYEGRLPANPAEA